MRSESKIRGWGVDRGWGDYNIDTGDDIEKFFDAFEAMFGVRPKEIRISDHLVVNEDVGIHPMSEPSGYLGGMK